MAVIGKIGREFRVREEQLSVVAWIGEQGQSGRFPKGTGLHL